MNVIVFASRKGGSGKSTLAAHLAAQIKASKQVMLVDADPQGSLTLWHKLRGTNEPPIKAAVNSVSGIVSAAKRDGYEWVLIDTPPNLSAVVEAQHARGLASLIGLPQLTILNWYVWPLFPMFVIFYVSALAETNRPPFDLVEAESELVAGFMVEYGSTPYLLFMLGEYVAIVTMCAMATILFLGGWLPPVDLPPFNWVPGIIWFSLKVFFMFFLFAMAKAIVPRYRYDQLMRLGWKVFLPLSLAMVIVVSGVLHFADIAPK